MSAGSSSEWKAAPARPTLDSGFVDVWRASLEGRGRWGRELLSDAELARAARLAGEQDRERWALSRAILRALLGRYLEMDGRALAFTLAEEGKPAVEPAGVRFNLSHSDDLALYAFCRDVEVGVDLEHESRVRNPLAVARRILGPAEEERLRLVDPGARNREFLRSWVRHEAIAKCLGTGIPARPARGQPLTVLELDVARDAAGAVALAGPSLELRLFDWSG